MMRGSLSHVSLKAQSRPVKQHVYMLGMKMLGVRLAPELFATIFSLCSRAILLLSSLCVHATFCTPVCPGRRNPTCVSIFPQYNVPIQRGHRGIEAVCCCRGHTLYRWWSTLRQICDLQNKIYLTKPMWWHNQHKQTRARALDTDTFPAATRSQRGSNISWSFKRRLLLSTSVVDIQPQKCLEYSYNVMGGKYYKC